MCQARHPLLQQDLLHERSEGCTPDRGDVPRRRAADLQHRRPRLWQGVRGVLSEITGERPTPLRQGQALQGHRGQRDRWTPAALRGRAHGHGPARARRHGRAEFRARAVRGDGRPGGRPGGGRRPRRLHHEPRCFSVSSRNHASGRLHRGVRIRAQGHHGFRRRGVRRRRPRGIARAPEQARGRARGYRTEGRLRSAAGRRVRLPLRREHRRCDRRLQGRRIRGWAPRRRSRRAASVRVRGEYATSDTGPHRGTRSQPRRGSGLYAEDARARVQAGGGIGGSESLPR
jgi:hypothetical protein